MPAISLRSRWFIRHEKVLAPASVAFVVLVLGYAVGGLGYVVVNRLVGNGPFHHLWTQLDGAIPFVPLFVFAYVLVYVTPAFSAVLVRDRAELYRTFLALALNCAICFPVFLLYPVEMPRDDALPATLAGRLLALVHFLDRPVNCFPSHHVATAVTTFLAIRRQNAVWGLLFGLIAALIAISTVLVKQHYVVDVAAGIAVAAFTYVLSFPREYPRS